MVGVRTCVHKPEGHGQHNIIAATEQGEDVCVCNNRRAAKVECGIDK